VIAPYRTTAEILDDWRVAESDPELDTRLDAQDALTPDELASVLAGDHLQLLAASCGNPRGPVDVPAWLSERRGLSEAARVVGAALLERRHPITLGELGARFGRMPHELGPTSLVVEALAELVSARLVRRLVDHRVEVLS
jgi:hypothetical protein